MSNGSAIMRAGCSAGEMPIAELGGIGSLRGLHNAQNAACAAAAALALGLEPAAIQAGFAPSPGCRTGWRKSAGAARFSSSTIPRPPMPIRRRRRSPASATFSGSPAASRRPAASKSLRPFFPRIRKAYLIGEAADEFAATLARRRAARDRRHARQGVGGGRARCRSLRARPSRSCCCRRPAPRSTSIAISRCAATAFRDLVRALPGVATKRLAIRLISFKPSRCHH